jgi:hypothetical protein
MIFFIFECFDFITNFVIICFCLQQLIFESNNALLEVIRDGEVFSRKNNNLKLMYCLCLHELLLLKILMVGSIIKWYKDVML